MRFKRGILQSRLTRDMFGVLSRIERVYVKEKERTATNNENEMHRL